MGWGDPKIVLYGSQYRLVCNQKLGGRNSKVCGEILQGDNEKDVKKMWDQHKKAHKRMKERKENELRSKYKKRVAELVAEYDSIDNVPKSKFSGLRTKGIPGVPDGQNVTGLVYDDEGKRVPYEKLQRYVQGWE